MQTIIVNMYHNLSCVCTIFYMCNTPLIGRLSQGFRYTVYTCVCIYIYIYLYFVTQYNIIIYYSTIACITSNFSHGMTWDGMPGRGMACLVSRLYVHVQVAVFIDTIYISLAKPSLRIYSSTLKG